MAYGLDSGTVQILISARDATAAAFATVNARMKTLEVTAARVRTAVASVAKATAIIGTAVTIGGIVLATKVYGDFEQAIANTASVSSATAEELKQLEAAAREMGKTTAFSATQAGNAMYFLGSAGYDTTQIISALDGVMLLAGATQTDLAYTSESVVATLNMFNMEASESTRVSNTYAAAIANSQATMDKLTDSMRYIGPVANALGWTFEETTAALGVLFDMGFRGEQAGTILRGAIVKTIIPTEDATKVLAKYGLTLEDINPEIYSLSEQMDTLREANLSVAETMGIFQQRAGPGMLAILNADKEAIRELEEAITDTDAATEMYATQMNTMKGILTILKSALEEAGIVIGKKLAPHIRDAAEKFKAAIPTILAYMSTLKNELGPSIENVVAIFESAKGILKDLFGTDAEDEISTVATVINKLTEVMRRLFDVMDRNPALVKFALAIGAVTVALAYAVPAVLSLYTALHFLYLNPVILALAAITAALVYLEVEFGLVSDTTAQFGRGLDILKGKLEPVATGIHTLAENITPLVDKFNALKDTIESTKKTLETLYGFLPDVAKQFVGMGKDIADSAKKMGNSIMLLSLALQGPLGGAAAMLKHIYDLGGGADEADTKTEELGKSCEFTGTQIEKMLEGIKDANSEIAQYEKAAEAATTAQDAYNVAVAAVATAFTAWGAARDTLSGLDTLTQNITTAQTELAAILEESKEVVEETFSVWEAGAERVATAEEKLSDLTEARAAVTERANAKDARITQSIISVKERLLSTERALLNSQYALIRALEEYDDLQRSIAGQTLSVQSAEIAVKEAEAAYFAITKGFAPIKIGFSFPGMGDGLDPYAEEKAWITWQNAILGLEGAIDNVSDSQERLNALKGAEEIEKIVAAQKGLSAEAFKAEFYIGGQLDIETLKDSISEADVEEIATAITAALPDIDLGTGVESILSAIVGHEENLLSYGEQLLTLDQDRVDLANDLYKAQEKLNEDWAKWDKERIDALEDILELEKDKIKAAEEYKDLVEEYGDAITEVETDRLTRARTLYSDIKRWADEYNTKLGATKGTYDALKIKVGELEAAHKTAITNQNIALETHKTKLADVKKLVGTDLITAWTKWTTWLKNNPANATVNVTEFLEDFKGELKNIEDYADANPAWVPVDFPDFIDWYISEKAAVEAYSKDHPLVLDTKTGAEYEKIYGAPGLVEPPTTEKSEVMTEIPDTAAEERPLLYDPISQSYYYTPRPLAYDPISETYYHPPVESEQIPTVPSPITRAHPDYPEIDETIPIMPDTQQLTDWNEVSAKYDELPSSYSADPSKWNEIWKEYETLFEAYNRNYDPDYDRDNRPFAHTGGETLKEGLINVEGGEWIFPRDVVAQFKELLTLPSLAPTAQAVSNTINVHIDTITSKADADHLIAELERKFNRRALV